MKYSLQDVFLKKRKDNDFRRKRIEVVIEK